jgi:hypothetical protein
VVLNFNISLAWGKIPVGRISEASSAIGRGGKVRRMTLRLSALHLLAGRRQAAMAL